ncbi:MAG TPA: hypothetical protein VF756_26725 [Thermoanaerobaculia bacterium]
MAAIHNPQTRRGRAGIAGALVFLVLLVLFHRSPVRQRGDSRYSLLLSESLLVHGSFALDRYFGDGELPYQVERTGGHVYYLFPPGSSVLSLPLVALLRLSGATAVAPGGGYDDDGEAALERRVAAFLGAVFGLCVFLLARLLLPVGWSAVIALSLGLGTQVWSTVTRAHWSHGWFVVLGALAVYELLAAEQRQRRPRGWWLGSLLAWSYFTRPTAIVPLIAVALWLAFRHRRSLPAFLAACVFWMGLLTAWSWSLYQKLLPAYFQPGRLGSEHFFEAIAGNLISPARGMLLFSPLVLFIAYLAIRYRKELPYRSLAVLAAAVSLVHLLVISSYGHWWGGYSYGPRLMTDALPWIALLAVLGVEGWRRAGPVRLEKIAGVVLVALSVFWNGAGAWSQEANRWNARPVSVDKSPERVWDWRDPQLLAWR